MSTEERLERLGLGHLKDRPQELAAALERLSRETRAEEERWHAERQRLLALRQLPEAAARTFRPRGEPDLDPTCRRHPAVHEASGAQVTLEVLAEGVPAGAFLAAARALRGSTPGLPSYLEWGEGARPWRAARELAGETLAARLERGGPLPVAEALVLGERLALALGAAHGLGVGHGGLTPHRVVLGPTPVVVGFGVPRVLPGVGLLENPAYLAPEQLAGAAAGPAADVFALGGLVYRTLAPGLPFDAEDGGPIRMLSAMQGGRWRRLRPERADVPPALEALLERVLAFDPARRPSMAEVARALAAR